MFSLISFLPKINFSPLLGPSHKSVMGSIFSPPTRTLQTEDLIPKREIHYSLKNNQISIPFIFQKISKNNPPTNWMYLSIKDHELKRFSSITQRYSETLAKLNLNFILNIQPTLEIPKTSNLLYITSEFFHNQQKQLQQKKALPTNLSKHNSSLQTSLLKIKKKQEPLLKSLEPIVEAGKLMACFITESSPSALQRFKSAIDNMLEQSQNPYFHALKNHPDITVCSCRNCRQTYGKETRSPFGYTDRSEFTETLLKRIQRLFPDTQKPLNIAALGAGGTFQELIIHSSLIALGYTCNWTIVDSYYAEYSGKSSASEFQKLAKNISSTTKTSVSESRPEDFVASNPEKFDIVFMIHNDNAFSENETRKKWRSICNNTHVRANLQLNFNRERENRYLLESSGKEVPAPVRTLDTKDSEQLLENFFRFYIAIHSAYDAQIEKGLLNTSGTITPRGDNQAKTKFLKAIDKALDFDFGNKEEGLNTIIPGVPQIFRPHSDNTFSKGASWLLAMVDTIVKNTKDRSQTVTIKSLASQGYLNELFVHLLLQKMDFSDVRWVIAEPQTRKLNESERIFSYILNGAQNQSDYQAPVCTIVKASETSSKCDFELDTVTAKISVMSKPQELRTCDYSFWKTHTL